MGFHQSITSIETTHFFNTALSESMTRPEHHQRQVNRPNTYSESGMQQERYHGTGYQRPRFVTPKMKLNASNVKTTLR
ncbi:hypothetical protein BDR04DRAFT_1098855 [Suillus decipiens]|nr:hypothetical protein BDR04DRAFT_1098855 [Suillus decipiens]